MNRKSLPRNASVASTSSAPVVAWRVFVPHCRKRWYASASMVKKDTTYGQREVSMRPKSKTRDELHLCPAIGFSQIVGGKYKLRILWALTRRPLRYGGIRRSLRKGTLDQAITPRVLSRELKQLQERGLIHRKQYNVVPPQVEYSITERGAALAPILDAIVDWGLTGAHKEILGVAAA